MYHCCKLTWLVYLYSSAPLDTHTSFHTLRHTFSVTLKQGKAMPNKAALVDVLLLSIRDGLKGAQVFEHVKPFTTLTALKPNKFTEKNDPDDGFVVVRGHKGASEAVSADGDAIPDSDQVESQSVSQDCCAVNRGKSRGSRAV